MFQDFILNGQANGEVADVLTGTRFEPSLLRPFIDNRGVHCVMVNSRRKDDDGNFIFKKHTIANLAQQGINIPVANAATSLRKDEWILLDQVVVKAARQRLRAWDDLSAASSFGGFNGMAKLILEHESMSDPGEAVVDMDGLSSGDADQPTYQLEGLPLPITHSDFHFSSRRLTVARNTGTPIDTTMAEAASRRVAESIEKTLIGVETGVTFGDVADYSKAPTVYGYTNHPNRITKTSQTVPDGTNGPAILTDWLAQRNAIYDANFYGPFMVYTSNDWDEHLDNLFSTAEPSAGSLRTRLKEIDGIQDIRRLDFLTDTFTVIWVQLTSEVARAVNGMDITTVQWESHGGMRINFKVMAIQVPQLRSDFNGNMGLLHATT